MKTNKYAGECKECGGHVAAGKGILTSEWSNYKDDMEWVVRHADKSVCAAVKAKEEKDTTAANAITTGVNWIKANATSHVKDVQNGETVIYDGRRGYNGVGWLLTRTGNTLYLSSENGSDGVRWDETYIYEGTQAKIEDLLWTMML